MDIFSARLKWLRERKGLTQLEVAEAIAMSRPGYTKIEQGQREPKLEVLAKLPYVVGESVDFMLGVTDFTSKTLILNSQLIALYRTILKFMNDLQEIQLNPYSTNITFKYFDPSDPKMVESRISSIKNSLKKYKIEYEQKKEELIPLLSEIPMMPEHLMDDILSRNPWDEFGFIDDNE